MDFLANENFPLTSIHLLKDKGYNTASVLQDSPGAKDPAILERAAVEKRIILTFDRDYGELIYRYKLFMPAGVVYFRFDPLTPQEPAEFLLDIIKQGNITLLEKFTVVERDRLRQRLLPGISGI